MSRVCLLVDHPLRDLEGMVLLAAQLAVRGTEVFLVPMYQKHEVFALRPDFLVLNYLRHAHRSLVNACLAADIRVGVLDTEGGVRNDFATFADQIAPFLQGVTLYCAWGAVQRDVLADAAHRAGVRLVETGSPRYDFAVAPWRHALRHREPAAAATVLVNTNFPTVNPRFGSVEHEIREMLRCGWTEAVARRRLEQTRAARDEMLGVVQAAASRCPEARIVVRPHPFESGSIYDDTFKQYGNVQVRQEGSVFEEIASARVLLHHNCSTAIEAFMMGVEPIMIDWLDTPLLDQPSSRAVSHRAPSRELMVESVVEALNGRPLQPTEAIRHERRQVIERFFHANDGRSAERAALAILDALPAGRRRISDVRYAVRACSSGGGVAVRGHRAATLILGSAVSRSARDLVRPSRANPAKTFAVTDVGSILSRLSRVHPPFGGLAVARADRRHTISVLSGGGLSVRIAAA